jgi:Spy/CpxP family protein refolding chaperone
MKRLTWRNIQLIVLILCGLVSLPSFVFAHPPDAPPVHGRRFEKLIEEINLDEKTLTEVKKILDASQAKHKELFGRLRAAHKRMRALLEQENPDEAAVMTQADSIGALETEARKQRLRTMLQVHALLTAEQRAKLLEKLRTRRPPGRHRFRGHEEGPRESRPPAE